jgi:prephenate dehydrogenase/chorismate mutase
LSSIREEVVESLKKEKARSKKEQSLDIHREEIQNITKSILDLALARQAVATEIADTKKFLGQSIENKEVEKRLLSSMIDYANSIGLNSDLARTIINDLIRYSKLVQSENIHKEKIQLFLKSKKISKVAVVGAGRMGGWFAKYFQDLGVEVFLYDDLQEKSRSLAKQIHAEPLDNIDKVTNSDLIVISIPISKTPSLIQYLSEYGRKKLSKSLDVIEISSVKNGMENSGLFEKGPSRKTKLSLYSVHPLFGASAQAFERNSIIQVYPTDTSFLSGLFPQANVIFLDSKDHDRLMGLFLTLPHALALAFADLVLAPEELRNSIRNLSGPSFSHMLELSKRTLSENPEVYFEIQASNPYSNTVLSELISSVSKIQKTLKHRSDFEGFFAETKKKTESYF